MSDYHRPYAADRIEREHGGQGLREIILDYRSVGTSWKIIAGILGVNYNTLTTWRRWYGLPVDGRKVFDFKPGPPSCVETLAEQQGYASFADLLYDWRLTQRLTVTDCAKRLGVSPMTIRKFTPPSLKGLRHNTERNVAAANRNLTKAWAAADAKGRTGIKFGRGLLRP